MAPPAASRALLTPARRRWPSVLPEVSGFDTTISSKMMTSVSNSVSVGWWHWSAFHRGPIGPVLDALDASCDRFHVDLESAEE